MKKAFDYYNLGLTSLCTDMNVAYFNFNRAITYFRSTLELENDEDLILKTNSLEYEELICNQLEVNIRFLNCVLYTKLSYLNPNTKNILMKYFSNKITNPNENSIEYTFFNDILFSIIFKKLNT